MHKETVNIGTEHGTEYAGKYVFQELTWAKRSRIIQKHTKYHPITGQVVNSDFIAIQAETIWATLKEQPQNQPLTLDKLLGEGKRHPNHVGRVAFKNRKQPLCTIKGRNHFFIRAIRRQNPHPAITEFRLCKEFGWTPTQLTKQPARTIHQFTIILNEIDEQTEQERRKTEKEAKKT